MLLLLAPFAPHISEELWHSTGGVGLVSLAPWPKVDPALLKEDLVALAVQVNGKKRGLLSVAADLAESEALTPAPEIDTVKNAIGDATIRKVIYVQGKILNIIAK